jgi:hypothetical protein
VKVTADTITDDQIVELHDMLPTGDLDREWLDKAFAYHRPIRRRARRECARLWNERIGGAS